MRLALLLVVAANFACARQAAHAPAKPSPHHGQRAMTSTTASLGMYPPQWGLPSRIIDTQRKIAVPLEEMLDDLMAAKVIYIAENHNNPHHHAIQGGLIFKIWARDRAIALGMEMFQQPYQSALDAYLKGEADEEELLAKTEYEDRWGFDFGLYRPILEIARAHKIPVHALNAPSELTKKVSKNGLESLSKEERASLPELDMTSSAHREMLKEAFDGHDIEASKFEQFYAVQVIWDETMAQKIADVLNGENAPSRLIVLAGSGHVRRFGIPERAARRGAKDYRSIMPLMLSDEDPTALEAMLAKPTADYVWVLSTDEAKLPPLEPAPQKPAETPEPASVTRY